MPFAAFLDTCVLYPAYLCDTLLRLADACLYRPLWSDDVLTGSRQRSDDTSDDSPRSGSAGVAADCRKQFTRRSPASRNPATWGS